CRFCGATSMMQGGVPAAAAAPVLGGMVDAIGAKALAYDFKNQHGVDLTKDGQAMDRLGKAWMKAVAELETAKKTEINLPFLAATNSGPLHFQRELDDRTMKLLYALAKKLG